MVRDEGWYRLRKEASGRYNGNRGCSSVCGVKGPQWPCVGGIRVVALVSSPNYYSFFFPSSLSLVRFLPRFSLYFFLHTRFCSLLHCLDFIPSSFRTYFSLAFAFVFSLLSLSSFSLFFVVFFQFPSFSFFCLYVCNIICYFLFIYSHTFT